MEIRYFWAYFIIKTGCNWGGYWAGIYYWIGPFCGMFTGEGGIFAELEGWAGGCWGCEPEFPTLLVGLFMSTAGF